MKIKDRTFMVVACLIGFTLFLTVIYKISPILLIFGKIGIGKIGDGKISKDTRFIGKTITIQPIAKLGKLKKYTNNARDNYHYLLTDSTEYLKAKSKQPFDVIDIDEPTEFTVIEEREDTSFGLGPRLFCVFKSKSGLTFAEDCSQIKKIGPISDFLMELRKDFLTKKSAYLGLFLFDKSKDTVFRVNNVQVIKVKSEDELIENFDNDDYDIPIPITSLDMQKMFLVEDQLKESQFYSWYFLKPAYMISDQPKDLFAKNQIPNEVLQTIQKLEPNSIHNRWLLTQIYISARERYLDEKNYMCFKQKYLGDVSKFDSKVKKLKDVSKNPEINYTFYNYYGFNCNEMIPPTVIKEVKIIEGLI